MPAKKKYTAAQKRAYAKRMARKRAAKKRNYKAKNRMILRRSPAPLQTMAKLRYHTRFQIDPNNTALVGAIQKDGSLAAHWFRLNSLNDPDYTSVTQSNNVGDRNHQPYGYDQWTAIYNSYEVFGVRMTATFFNQNTATQLSNVSGADEGDPYTITPVPSNYGVFVGVHFDDDITLENSISHMFEVGNVKARTLMPGQKTTITKNWSQKAFRKILNSKVNEIQCDAQYNQNPLTTAYAACLANAISPVPNLNIPPIDCHVQLEFIAKFRDLRDIVQS